MVETLPQTPHSHRSRSFLLLGFAWFQAARVLADHEFEVSVHLREQIAPVDLNCRVRVVYYERQLFQMMVQNHVEHIAIAAIRNRA